MRGRWLNDLLEALPLPLKGVLLILVGIALLFFGWINLKSGRGIAHTLLLALLGLFSCACGVAILITLSGTATQ